MLTGIFAHGPLLALAASLLVSPVLPAGMAVMVEHQRWRWSQQYKAFAIGDIALAVTVSAGAAVQPSASDDLWGAVSRWQYWVLLAAVTLSLWQWRDEVKHGIYTRSQALSPTKVWHQVLTVPLISVWVFGALILTGAQYRQHPLATLIASAGVIVWLALMAYDKRHPQQGHVEFDWGEAMRGKQ